VRSHPRRLVLALGIFALLIIAPCAESNVVPIRRLTDPSTGLVTLKLGNDLYRASGVVARDPRLVYTAAHLLFHNGRWATAVTFHPDYHRSTLPQSGGLRPRGFRYRTSFVSQTRRYGEASVQSHAEDFAVLYAHRDFGPAVGYWTDGSAVVRDARQSKRIVGYPALLDHNGRAGGAFQHSTDYFRISAFRSLGAYHVFDRVSTGPGTSGGPVYVTEDGVDHLAGLLISGTRSQAGIYALDASAHSLAAAALGDANGRSGIFRNRQAFTLRDGAASFAARSVKVSLPGTIRRLHLDTRISTSFRGDLDVYLRSPSGRVRWVSRRAGGAAQNLDVRQAEYSGTFRGLRANGTWRLYMRDARIRNRARYHSFTLYLTAQS
jgi:V8-like Glu-specific endopeptidase